MPQLDYSSFNQSLRQHQIPVNACEVHGFLTGLICANIMEINWQSLLFEFTNDNTPYPASLLSHVETLFQQIKQSLTTDELTFQLYLPEESIFSQIDGLGQWVNHFLLGLGIAQPQLDKQTDEINEALKDLQDIATLSYEEDEDIEELSRAFEEVTEYVRILVMFFYAHFCGITPTHNSHSN